MILEHVFPSLDEIAFLGGVYNHMVTRRLIHRKCIYLLTVYLRIDIVY